MLKLDSSGAYQWHTFYGSGSSYNYSGNLTLDGSDNISITGGNWGTWTGLNGQAPLHKKFDEVEDISKYLDLSRASRPGRDQKRWMLIYLNR